MKIAIIGNGQEKKISFDKKRYDFIIATDGGANWCVKNKVTPNLIIGDFDSIKTKTINFYKNVEQIIITNQNSTDLKKTLEYIKSKYKNTERIDLYNVTSAKRLDHVLANIFLIKNYAELPIKLIHYDYILEVIDGYKKIENQKGKTVSLFVLQNTSGLKMNGFKWKLNDNDIKKEMFSISNIITSNKAEINIKKGKIILIINN